MKYILFSLSAAACLLASTPTLEAISFKNVNIAAGEKTQSSSENYVSENFNIDGEAVYTEAVSVTANRITGKGVIRAPKITLRTKKFEFKGTMDCSEKCTISSMDTVDVNSFKRTGDGQYIINGTKLTQGPSKGVKGKK